MFTLERKAFTMLELTFVIVVIGILSAVAIPKFAATRDDATISKAKTTVAAIRNSVATERQKRILKGTFTNISQLSSTGANTTGADIFNGFDGNTSNSVLSYPLLSCKSSTAQGCWIMKTKGAVDTNEVYTYRMPVSGTVDFNLANNRFVCTDPTSANCKLLTR